MGSVADTLLERPTFDEVFSSAATSSGQERGAIRQAGLPALALPVPTSPPVVRPTPPVVRPTAPSRFPIGAPAANDPIFSRAIPFLRLGSLVVGVASALDLLVREIQEQTINRQQREREEVDRLVARRLGSDNPLSEIEISAPLDRPAAPASEVLEKIEAPRSPTAPPSRAPDPTFTPEVLPEIETPGVSPGPVITPVPLEIPSPTVTPRPLARPSTRPLPVGTPGIGTPSPVFVPPPRFPFSFPISPPVAFPVFPPVQFPRTSPVGDPLTPFAAPGVPSPGTPPQLGDVELPQQQPAPQPNQDKCKPAKRRKKRRKRRDKCFKGLYREGPWDDQVAFTKWVEIDCSSGRELGARRRPSGPPELRIVSEAKKIVKQLGV